MSSASGSGPQMDYSKSNHNTWIWDAVRAREGFLLLPHSMFVHHHLSIIVLVMHATSPCPFQPPAAVATTTPAHWHFGSSGFEKRKCFAIAKICQCNNHSIGTAMAYINNVKGQKPLIDLCLHLTCHYLNYINCDVCYNANTDLISVKPKEMSRATQLWVQTKHSESIIKMRNILNPAITHLTDSAEYVWSHMKLMHEKQTIMQKKDNLIQCWRHKSLPRRNKNFCLVAECCTGCCHSLSIEGVGTRNDVGAVPAHQEVHSVIESPQVALCRGHLCLLDDVQGVRGAHTQRGGVTGCLQTAVWIHAVHQAIWQGQTSHTHPLIKQQPGQTPGRRN